MSNELTVQVQTHMYNSYYSEERYGDWSEDSSYEGCSVYQKGSFGKIGAYTTAKEVDFDVQVGMIVFPVIVVYSSGNSFGRSTGEVAVAGVYDTPEKAKKIADAIQANSEIGRNAEYTIKVDDEEVYCGAWVGYFECLESVHVETEVVKA